MSSVNRTVEAQTTVIGRKHSRSHAQWTVIGRQRRDWHVRATHVTCQINQLISRQDSKGRARQVINVIAEKVIKTVYRN